MHQDINAGVGLDAPNDRRVSAALVNGDLLWHIVQVDGALQKPSGSSQIALGREKKVNRIAYAVNRAVKVLLLTGYFGIGLVHLPTKTNGSFAPPEDSGQHR